MGWNTSAESSEHQKESQNLPHRVQPVKRAPLPPERAWLEKVQKVAATLRLWRDELPTLKLNLVHSAKRRFPELALDHLGLHLE